MDTAGRARGHGNAARAASAPALARTLALLMILLIVAAAALVAAWKFAPDRVPSALRPVELMRLVGVNVGGPVRRPLPPNSQFDE